MQVDDFNYAIYVTSNLMSCFGCGLTGHLVRACPEKRTKSANGSNEHSEIATEDQPASDNAPTNGEEAVVEGDQPSGAISLCSNVPEITPPDQDVSVETVGIETSEAEAETPKTDNSQGSMPDSLNEGCGEDVSQVMETEENPFKVPKGRKRGRRRSGSDKDAKKKDLVADVSSTDAESEGEFSDCSLSYSLRQHQLLSL